MNAPKEITLSIVGETQAELRDRLLELAGDEPSGFRFGRAVFRMKAFSQYYS